MKPTLLMALLLAAQSAYSQDINHESNGDGLKLSLDVPGAQGSATAGGGATNSSSIIPSTSGTVSSEKQKTTPAVPADYIRSTPEPGSSGGYRESTVYLEHNGKSVKVTRRPGRYGVDEVTVTTQDGKKEKVEVMTPAEYDQKYLRKKGPKEKPAKEGKPGGSTGIKEKADQQPGSDSSTDEPATPVAPTPPKVEKVAEREVRESTSESAAAGSSSSKAQDEKDRSASESPTAPQKPNRATE